MKQILQNLSDGVTNLVDVPAPLAGAGQLLIRTSASVLSAGTERMLVEFGKAGWIDKARQQPDKVRQVLDKLRTDGLASTIEAVRSKLDQPLPLGYCNAGHVIAVGPGVEGFAIGDHVVSNGKHAEIVAVPRNLCAHIPAGVDDESAAFAVLAAIGLQGVRLAAPTLGEAVVVTGLGVIGLLTAQLLRANGCRVLGIDFDPGRLALARQFGAQVVDLSRGEDPVAAADAFSRGRGVDAVLLAASTTSSEPVAQAARMCRKRGRIVLVGVTGLELSRADFYEKELSFQVSCSYGPGRYDPAYEEKGQDYPVGFVRWTEQRNFEAVLDMMATGALDVTSLVSHRFDIANAPHAYELLASDEPSTGIVLQYPAVGDIEPVVTRTISLTAEQGRTASSAAAVAGFIGAGNFGGRVLISAFADAGATLQTLASAGGVSAVHHGRKYGFRQATTDTGALLADPAINTVVIGTRHDTHADFASRALQSGKHVFVEKPLCLTLEELAAVESNYIRAPGSPLLMVGFNRRFAPQIVRMKRLLDTVREPKQFIMTVNAGAIPAEHWTQDPSVGGGRIVGEACHFVDLLRHLASAAIRHHLIVGLDGAKRTPVGDSVAITLSFADGSVGTIHYLANGHRSVGKERLEVFCAGRVLQLDNFRRLRGHGWPGFRSMNLWSQDKGHRACVRAFVEAITHGRAAPIPIDEILEVSRVAIELAGHNAVGRLSLC
ncbi:bi-domain-containing oxidoreductase [Emcibacter sp. SYSU 3D8]|uniref:bi-domain-containing oxidoreductase n=1 Tax=Emcibacter sp. SYSU 3D8 TaxID=3133969 RepID=UPI0031FEB3F7